ncbi:hypothetical protein FA15DRAFT_705954 [Coprinopsis marcescibilis]|uniref:Uncharacterized protein n=1 Tax=Coprinopsis marcescibilis TaxID=230819 RepID=A0A5C3KRP6_COPMA|nr:hypothetical protein FA15DRAFT_705954 [Coprinopsis marcescibilis]
MFRDIRRKGATVNGNCKTFERAHRPVRLNYQLRTNFKDVYTQLYRMNSESTSALEIRNGIKVLDELRALREEAELDGDNAENDCTVPDYPHISFGSRERSPRTISTVIADCPDKFKSAFQNLHRKIADHLIATGAAQEYIRLLPMAHEIREYRLVRAEYESYDDWALRTDLIRANAMFHRQEQYDCLIYQVSDNTVSLGRLLLAFIVVFNGVTEHLALITPLDLHPSVTNRARDSDFNLVRVQQRQLSDSIVIHAGSIL